MSCFVYGTLMYPEVLMALIQRVPRMQPAVIQGYKRYAIRGQVFPGTIRTAGAQVSGLVLFDLQPLELEMLDEFEGDEYFKEGVDAELEGGGACSTTVYLWQDRLRPLLHSEWCPEQFREQQLESYVEMCRGFAADVQAQRGWKGNFPTPSSSENEDEREGQAAADGGEEQHGEGQQAGGASAAAPALPPP